MSRCTACDKILSDFELDGVDENDGLCWTCISAALSQYNILTDKEYQLGNFELPDNLTQIGK